MGKPGLCRVCEAETPPGILICRACYEVEIETSNGALRIRMQQAMAKGDREEAGRIARLCQAKLKMRMRQDEPRSPYAPDS